MALIYAVRRAPRNPERALSDFGLRAQSPLPLGIIGGVLFTESRPPLRIIAAMNEAVPPIKVHHHNHYLISFFAGREQAARFAEERNWVDDSAIKLGTAMYAIHSGAEAVVYDTFTSVAHAEFVRGYLEKMGIRKFTVALSHWHLDHIAGNAVFEDCAIIAPSLTRDALARHQADIEAGKVWGPPAIKPLVFPNIMFDDHLEVRVGEIVLELRRMNIHSIDGCVVCLPKDGLLLAGDTLEDPLTYMIEVENLAEHLRNLREMQGWDIAKILPNHGDPDLIATGGFDKTLIDATMSYVTKMLSRAHDPAYLQGTMEDFIGDSAAKGWVHPFEPYREVHEQNLKLVHDYWKDKTLPEIAP
jgi:glyoxylase-like metal-dependent hydrolase (beta-lactamase superfamily II)